MVWLDATRRFQRGISQTPCAWTVLRQQPTKLRPTACRQDTVAPGASEQHKDLQLASARHHSLCLPKSHSTSLFVRAREPSPSSLPSCLWRLSTTTAHLARPTTGTALIGSKFPGNRAMTLLKLHLRRQLQLGEFFFYSLLTGPGININGRTPSHWTIAPQMVHPRS